MVLLSYMLHLHFKTNVLTGVAQADVERSEVSTNVGSERSKESVPSALREPTPSTARSASAKVGEKEAPSALGNNQSGGLLQFDGKTFKKKRQKTNLKTIRKHIGNIGKTPWFDRKNNSLYECWL